MSGARLNVVDDIALTKMVRERALADIRERAGRLGLDALLAKARAEAG